MCACHVYFTINLLTYLLSFYSTDSKSRIAATKYRMTVTYSRYTLKRVRRPPDFSFHLDDLGITPCTPPNSVFVGRSPGSPYAPDCTPICACVHGSRLRSTDTHTHRQTDHATSVATGRICFCWLPRRPKTFLEKEYDTRCYYPVRSKADMSQLNLPHGTDN